jgi:16S rRNA (guanine1207-N2)-methyltransferase
MNSHYFTDSPELVNDEKSFNLRIRGEELKFFSNAGMFSHGEPDQNSLMLIREINPKFGAAFLDLGCGYGLIGVTINKLYDIKLTMSDVNSSALSYAQKNAKQNGVKADCIKSDGFSEIDENFDIITLNPPIHAGKDVCYRLYEESACHLNPGGSFYIVIMDKHGMKSHKGELQKIFTTVDIIKRQNGINVIKCKLPEDNNAD